MPGELDRWAAGRAGELIARAEAEAVAELKAALLRAATGSAPAREAAPPAAAPPAAVPQAAAPQAVSYTHLTLPTNREV